MFFLGLKKKAYYDDMYLFFIWQIGKLSNLVGLLYILKESPQKQTHFLLRNDINFSYLVFQVFFFQVFVAQSFHKNHFYFII